MKYLYHKASERQLLCVFQGKDTFYCSWK